MIKIAIIGLGHAFQKQVGALRQNKNFELVALCDKNKRNLVRYKGDNLYLTTNYKTLVNKCECVLISSPPCSHLKIMKFFIKHNIKIMVEKPIVINSRQFDCLLSINNDNKIYNCLHFSFGKEIEWWINNKRPDKPRYIKCLITDKYMENNKILPKAINLHGAYLDETINPLSAIARIYGYEINNIYIFKRRLPNNKYDSYSMAKFVLNEIDIEIEVDWARNQDEKYIDLIFDNEIIRLDSKRQLVKELSSDKILFSGEGERMTNHYIGAFDNYLITLQNKEKWIKLYTGLFGNYEK